MSGKSNYGGKSSSQFLLAHVHDVAPIKRVLDVGPGRGMYSTLLRQPGQYWIGAEAWGPYVTEYNLASKYDQVIVCDIRYLDWSQVAPLDLVILGDVLEHMTRAEAAQVVEKALTHGRIALISLPIVHAPQGEVAGNPFEAHVEEDWTDAEAKAAFPDWCVNILESYIGVYFLTRRAEDRRHLTERAQKFEMVLAREKNDLVKIHLPQRA